MPSSAPKPLPMVPYDDFLKSKVRLAQQHGFQIELSEINPILKPHQKAMVQWMVAGGLRACFAAFGLGKSVIQLEVVRIILAREGGRGLITAPLGVRQEFIRDAYILATGDHPEISDAQRAELAAWQQGRPERVPEIRFIRRIEEAGETGIYLTNYESVRDGKLDPRHFKVASLDEASCLRGFGGTKTFREFMRLFTTDGGPNGNRRGEHEVPYRFVATATPSPNDYIELLAYAAFLGIMDVSQAKTRFFKRDSTKADQLTLHAHKEEEFWLWVASWALFVQKPSDLGFSDEGYELPELEVVWHELPVDHTEGAGMRRDGQIYMFRNAAIGVQNAAREKRDSLEARIAKMLEIRAETPEAHRIIWHDLEAERVAIEKAIPSVVSVYGSQNLEERELSIISFSNGGRDSRTGGQAHDAGQRLQLSAPLPPSNLSWHRFQVQRLYPKRSSDPALFAKEPGANRFNLHRERARSSQDPRAQVAPTQFHGAKNGGNYPKIWAVAGSHDKQPDPRDGCGTRRNRGRKLPLDQQRQRARNALMGRE